MSMFLRIYIRIFAPHKNDFALKQKHFKYINTLFIVLPMTLIMAFVGIVRNHGFEEGFFEKFMAAWVVMLPVAYLAAFIIVPRARKLAEKVIVKP
ncbi:uncharacterized protein DUF2798 [Chitinophaga skermanii]|uniref:Uncharacterized protein DUF2798 n=1 Tax=Chitinophaga skermanii TaxID=331697 RepID=A0A327Q7P7_9BACT|nr:DUF2798 domain-containing protein [Chitinophaga skermanii]RAJ00420.1 uncharacterized protein DUF2798 [Chitinophaga skermanii]